MGKSKIFQILIVFVVCGFLAASFVFAANEPAPVPQQKTEQVAPPRPEQGGPRGEERGFGRGGFDRDAMQARMVEMMKERLSASDEEWKVIEPRLGEVMKLSLSASGRGGMMRGMFGRGRPDRGLDPNAGAASDPVEKAMEDLQQTLDKEAASTTEINNKLLALRGVREQARQKLIAAQGKLREVLSVKQEAQLVLMGMLD